MKRQNFAWTVFAGLLLALAACSGSSSNTASNTPSGSSVPNTPSSAAAISSGAISAFGSVFVNGHEFSTAGAKVIDDDTGSTSTSTGGLEVGVVVDVKGTSDSSGSNPAAGELHVHPLARGYVDVSDTTTGTLTVMGQTVQITSATLFSDHRSIGFDRHNGLGGECRGGHLRHRSRLFVRCERFGRHGQHRGHSGVGG